MHALTKTITKLKSMNVTKTNKSYKITLDFKIKTDRQKQH